MSDGHDRQCLLDPRGHCYPNPMGVISRVLQSVRMALLAVAFWFASVIGCAGVATQLQRTTYAAEVARCIANERAIVDGPLPQAEAQEALDFERARCDNALDAIAAEVQQ